MSKNQLLIDCQKYLQQDLNLSYDGLGCAASVGILLFKNTGRSAFLTPSTIQLEAVLEKWTKEVPTEKAQAGDIIIISTNGFKIGHVGILGNDGLIYANSSSKKVWSSMTVAQWRKQFEAHKKPRYFNVF